MQTERGHLKRRKRERRGCVCLARMITPQMASVTAKMQPDPTNYQLPGCQTIKAKLAHPGCLSLKREL
jgi:hypothetical protein